MTTDIVRYIWGHTLSTDLWGAFFTFFLALETHLDPLLAFKYVQEGGTALAGRTEHGAPTNPSPQLVIPYRTASRPYCIFRVRMDDDRSAYVRYTGGNESAAVYPRRTATKSCSKKKTKSGTAIHHYTFSVNLTPFHSTYTWLFQKLRH